MSSRDSLLVGPLLRFAHEREYVPELAQYGLREDALTRDVSPIADAALGRLIDHIALALGEPNIGLVLPAQLRFERYALPELAARASPTLREALQQWMRFSALLHPAVELEFEEHSERARLTHRTLGHPRGLSRHLNEFALAAAVQGTRESSGAHTHTLPQRAKARAPAQHA